MSTEPPQEAVRRAGEISSGDTGRIDTLNGARNVDGQIAVREGECHQREYRIDGIWRLSEHQSGERLEEFPRCRISRRARTE